MAEAQSHVLIPDDLVHCSLCLEVFTQPKGLPCFHTFCLQCLQSYIATNNFISKLKCPLCQTETVIPGNDATQFQNNFLVTNLVQSLEDFKKTPEEKVKIFWDKTHICHGCDVIRHGNDFCETCQMWLCNICSKGHKRFPATGKHVIKTNLDMDRSLKEKFADKSSALRGLKRKIKNKISSLEKDYQAVTAKQQKLTEQIQSAADRFRKLIDKQEKSLIEKVDHFHQESKQRIEDLILKAEEHSLQIERSEEDIQHIQNVVDGQDHYQFFKDFEADFNETVDDLRDFMSDKSQKLQKFEVFEHNLTTVKTIVIGTLKEGKYLTCVVMQMSPLVQMFPRGKEKSYPKTQSISFINRSILMKIQDGRQCLYSKKLKIHN